MPRPDDYSLTSGDVHRFRGFPIRTTVHEGQRLIDADDVTAALGCRSHDEVAAALRALPDWEKRLLGSIAAGVPPWELERV
jgi:prophage antirepressor-like protein